MKIVKGTVSVTIDKRIFEAGVIYIKKNLLVILVLFLSFISVASFIYFLNNGLGLAYNDARSHLDIGRRVVEGLKPGLAQIGSVWLPLPHILMIPTVWNDFMWHTGLSGSLQSMVSFVGTGILIYLTLRRLAVGHFGRIAGVLLFALNINILYLQSIAMTELILIFTMTYGVYELIRWHQDDNILNLIKSSFWIMLSSLIRYDGWFLLLLASVLVIIHTIRKGVRRAEGTFILFATLGGFGVALWVLWNQLIFKDALYFMLGPFSARAQQKQLEEAGVLITEHNLWLSTKVYLYSLVYNSYMIPAVLALAGSVMLWFDKKIKTPVKIASIALLTPIIFNILALYLGHSVLFIQGISGSSWFNVRYGALGVTTIAIFSGFLVDRLKKLRIIICGFLILITLVAFANFDAVTIDDARVGSSQKNVSEVSGWLTENTANKKGFILISAASHDAIIFSSGLPMKRFIHEGTGSYWESATSTPDNWARWIIMRSYDDNDFAWRLVSKTAGFKNYRLVNSYPFADIYELNEENLDQLNTETVLKQLK